MSRVLRAPSLSGSLALFLLQGGGADFAAGFASISEKDLRVHVTEIASPELEGRDSPSRGLYRAGEYIIGRLKAAGVEPGGPDQTYRMGYSLRLSAPVPDQCVLAATGLAPGTDGEEHVFVLEEDFVPFPKGVGEAEGALHFLGFGITDSGERYDDLKGERCNGEIVMVLEGEPRHKKLFEGPVVTAAADAFAKVKALEEHGARGVLIVRRPAPEEPKGLDGKPVLQSPIGFRHFWAQWNPQHYHGLQSDTTVALGIPVLEITEAAASALLGKDVAELASKIDSSGKPLEVKCANVRVTVRSGLAERMVPIDNLVGLVRGSDPALAQEYLVLGAHYDHIGVDPWGRVGCGADDNGSGSSGLLELAQAFALAKPKRSILFAWFSSEEKGLDGSADFCERPPVPIGSIVTMLGVDMIGRLADDEAVVIGTHVNPAMEDVLKEAKKLQPTQLKKVFTDRGQDLWQRSDHYNFHQKGIPALFFTEGAIDADNPDYHVFSDTVEKLSLPKMARITRFMFNTAWLIANAEKRPPPPR